MNKQNSFWDYNFYLMKKTLLQFQPQITINGPKNYRIQQNLVRKYSLILSLKQLEAPVSKIVQHIFKHSKNTQNKENKRQFQRTIQKHTITTDKSTHHNSMNETYASKFKDSHVNSTQNRLNFTLSSPKKFTSRVSRILSRKKYSCIDSEDQIDRLNARLDSYISKNIGVQKVKQLRSSV